jgi:hypothetical protein
MKTTALSTLHDLAGLPHFTISINLVDRKTKHYSQASHLVGACQSFCLYANTKTARGITPELKAKTDILLFLNLVVYCFF